MGCDAVQFWYVGIDVSEELAASMFIFMLEERCTHLHGIRDGRRTFFGNFRTYVPNYMPSHFHKTVIFLATDLGGPQFKNQQHFFSSQRCSKLFLEG
jgi:hypothetical protein